MQSKAFWFMVVSMAVVGAARAQGAETVSAEMAAGAIWERETLTGNWFGAGDALADAGLSLSLSAT